MKIMLLIGSIGWLVLNLVGQQILIECRDRDVETVDEADDALGTRNS